MFEFESCWKKELALSISKPEDLLRQLNIKNAEFEAGFAARRLFPLRVPRPFVARMKPGDATDPLFLQVMTQANEFEQADGFVTDPLAEHDAVLPGLLHKYKSRVLLMVRGGCAINCRYCFRRHFPYQDNAINKQKLLQAVHYIAQDSQINEVVLSGGDPLMASDQHLSEIITALEPISHLQRIRIHTRLPVVIPQRVTGDFIELFSASRLQVIMVTHINHANEIDNFFKQAIAKLASNKFTLLNQAVLLKGINDNLSSLVNLSEALFAAGILPYYIHLLDKVDGAAHFYRDDLSLVELQRGMLAELPGFLVPKWVREEAGKQSKSPVLL
ncbi:EF-P beta-lysylation protein EpmB [Catenovulum sediminis]|uniref:L-lysine 2,3-aminomutase n=1 Tax=Catenovulum sediminis TaxID=1740262 RepID=A0ABV1RNB8_9ALTE